MAFDAGEGGAERVATAARGKRPSVLRLLFTPFRPARPGTMPAGLVLVVVVVGLLLAAVLNADATLRKSNAKDTDNALGDSRHWVAERVADLSDAVHANAPRAGIDEAVGRKTGTGAETTSEDQLLAEQQRLFAAQQVASAPPSASTAPGATTPAADPAAASGVVKLRTPTPEEPLRFWVGGDSIVGAFGPEMQKVASATGLFTPSGFSKPSSGLTRPDFYNWPEYLVKDVVPNQRPEVMVLMFGANDSQNMPIGKGGYKEFTPEWLAEYRKRVAATMDLMRSPTNDRLVIWCGALIMGPNSGVNGMDQLNYIYWSEAQQRPWVKYFDSWAFFADGAGNYQASLPNALGKTIKLRAADNIHLTTEGGDRLAWAVMGRIGKEGVDLTPSKGAPPAAQLAPPDVKERTDIPQPPPA